MAGAKWRAHGREGNARPPRGLLNPSVFATVRVNAFCGQQTQGQTGWRGEYFMCARDACCLEKVLGLLQGKVRLTLGANVH